jgi:hypothetical protein
MAIHPLSFTLISLSNSSNHDIHISSVVLKNANNQKLGEVVGIYIRRPPFEVHHFFLKDG